VEVGIESIAVLLVADLHLAIVSMAESPVRALPVASANMTATGSAVQAVPAGLWPRRNQILTTVDWISR
jgi:hypothetical protein